MKYDHAVGIAGCRCFQLCFPSFFQAVTEGPVQSRSSSPLRMALFGVEATAHGAAWTDAAHCVVPGAIVEVVKDSPIYAVATWQTHRQTLVILYISE